MKKLMFLLVFLPTFLSAQNPIRFESTLTCEQLSQLEACTWYMEHSKFNTSKINGVLHPVYTDGYDTYVSMLGYNKDIILVKIPQNVMDLKNIVYFYK